MLGSGITYGDLERLLHQWGFVLQGTEPYAVFCHPANDTLVVLPRYRPGARVAERHLVGVRKTLSERGVVPAPSRR